MALGAQLVCLSLSLGNPTVLRFLVLSLFSAEWKAWHAVWFNEADPTKIERAGVAGSTVA